MTKKKLKKVVKWEDGKNEYNSLWYLIFFLVGFFFISDLAFWKELIIIISFMVAGALIDKFELPKRKVYWEEIK